MVGQLESPFETLRKATAHLFRNLAWKADKNSKQVNLSFNGIPLRFVKLSFMNQLKQHVQIVLR